MGVTDRLDPMENANLARANRGTPAGPPVLPRAFTRHTPLSLVCPPPIHTGGLRLPDSLTPSLALFGDAQGVPSAVEERSPMSRASIHSHQSSATMDHNTWS